MQRGGSDEFRGEELRRRTDGDIQVKQLERSREDEQKCSTVVLRLLTIAVLPFRGFSKNSEADGGGKEKERGAEAA